MVSVAERRPIFTIGHSNHPAEKLGDLLTQHAIELLVDVRSSPYSKYASQFNKEPLQDFIATIRREYLYMGTELGGQPDIPGFYDAAGHVRYDLIAASARFQAGVADLLRLADRRTVGLLCSEENPAECHRHLLLGRVLGERGAVVLHIRGDGSLLSDDEVTQAAELERTGGQQSLFAEDEERPWRSTRSATRRNPPRSSSSD